MYQNIYKIEPSSFVTDIVVHDYRTADVFRKYDFRHSKLNDCETFQKIVFTVFQQVSKSVFSKKT